jgi:hypothetical protein
MAAYRVHVSETGAINPSIEPLAFLLGRWRGRGRGVFPTIDSFEYEEDVEFWHSGKPFLGYHQRTRIAGTGLPSHAESGFWRLPPIEAGNGFDDDSRGRPVEATIAHPTGICEVLAGVLVGQRIDVATTAVALTPTAKEITEVERSIVVEGDELTYRLLMAAVGQQLQLHLEGEMRRVG